MIKALFMASRPKTLVAAVLPVLAAVALAYSNQGYLEWSLFVSCLLAASFIQVATNFFNDAIDFTKGADTAERLGPKRATASGVLSARKMFLWAVIFVLLSFFVSLPIFKVGGPLFFLLGLISAFFAFSYTGGPFPLAYLGLGELFVFLFFGFLAVGGSYFLQTGDLSLYVWLLGLQIGALSSVLLAINNLRDLDEDRRSKKNTLAVRWGKKFGRWEILCLIIGTYGFGFLWWQWRPLAAVLPLLVLPLSLWILSKVFTQKPSQAYNKYLALSALQMILIVGLLIVGILWKT